MKEWRTSYGANGRAADAYLANQVRTATPLGLINMLYDGAISFLRRAEEAAGSGDWEEAQGLIRRAQDIVYELMGCLDMEKGGRIAVSLFRIYEYMGYRLVQAQLRRDAGIAAEVRGHLQNLREAWEEAERKVRAEAGKREWSAAL